MVTLLVISLIILIVGVIGAFSNMANAVNNFRKPNPVEGFGSSFKRHALYGILIAIGGIGTVASGVTLIVQAFVR